MRRQSAARRLALALVLASIMAACFVAVSLADALAVPSGSWKLHAGHIRYTGVKSAKVRARIYGYLPASVQLTPLCAELTCATKGLITLRNGRKLSYKLSYTDLEYSHDTGEVHFRGRLCGKRAKINFFLGASMVADDSGQPKALAGLARAQVYDKGCHPAAGGNVITRMTASPAG